MIHHFMSCKIDHRKISKKKFQIYLFFIYLSLWNEQSQVYQLDFGGRVTLESAKNFQIEFSGKQVIYNLFSKEFLFISILQFRLFNLVVLKIIVIHLILNGHFHLYKHLLLL